MKFFSLDDSVVFVLKRVGVKSNQFLNPHDMAEDKSVSIDLTETGKSQFHSGEHSPLTLS